MQKSLGMKLNLKKLDRDIVDQGPELLENLHRQ